MAGTNHYQSPWRDDRGYQRQETHVPNSLTVAMSEAVAENPRPYIENVCKEDSSREVEESVEMMQNSIRRLVLPSQGETIWRQNRDARHDWAGMTIPQTSKSPEWPVIKPLGSLSPTNHEGDEQALVGSEAPSSHSQNPPQSTSPNVGAGDGKRQAGEYKDMFFEQRTSFHAGRIQDALKILDVKAASDNISVIKKMVKEEVDFIGPEVNLPPYVKWASDLSKVWDLMILVLSSNLGTSKDYDSRRPKIPQRDPYYVLLHLVDSVFDYKMRKFEVVSVDCGKLLRLMKRLTQATPGGKPPYDPAVEIAAFYLQARTLEAMGNPAEAAWYHTQVPSTFAKSWVYKWLTKCLDLKSSSQ